MTCHLHQVIIWTSAGPFITEALRTNCSEICIKAQQFLSISTSMCSIIFHYETYFGLALIKRLIIRPSDTSKLRCLLCKMLTLLANLVGGWITMWNSLKNERSMAKKNKDRSRTIVYTFFSQSYEMPPYRIQIRMQCYLTKTNNDEYNVFHMVWFSGSCRWVSTRKTYLQCVSNGVTYLLQ